MNAVSLWRALLCVPFVIAASCAHRPADELDNCEIAQRYIDAANHSDPGLIAPLLHEDVAAIFLSRETDHAETIAGRSAVLEAVRTYKHHCPSCESSVLCHMQTPDAAYVTETVVFEGEADVRQQHAPLVLEFDAQRVKRIIYFPSDQAVPD